MRKEPRRKILQLNSQVAISSTQQSQNHESFNLYQIDLLAFYFGIGQ